jgi:hypothetical protein
MSVEYYLVSKKAKRFVWCGSDGLSGVKVNGHQLEVQEFLREAITNFWGDVTLVMENYFTEDGDGWRELEIINNKPEWKEII